MTPFAAACLGTSTDHSEIVKSLLEDSRVLEVGCGLALTCICLSGNNETLKTFVMYREDYYASMDPSLLSNLALFEKRLTKQLASKIRTDSCTKALMRHEMLVSAFSHNATEVYSFLLDRGECLEVLMDYFNLACKRLKLSIVLTFLEHPAVVFDQESLQNAFSAACKSDNSLATKIVQELLPVVDPIVNILGSKRNSRKLTSGYPLTVACFHANKETILLLLGDERVNPNSLMANNCAPFHCLCASGNSSIVGMMLDDKNIEIEKLGLGPESLFSFHTSYYTGNNCIVRSALYSDNIELFGVLLSHDRTRHMFDINTCREILQYRIMKYKREEKERKKTIEKHSDYGSPKSNLPEEIPTEYIDYGFVICTNTDFPLTELFPHKYAKECNEIKQRIQMLAKKSARK